MLHGLRQSCAIAPGWRAKTGDCSGPEVLGLYRKREWGRRAHEHSLLARFRYNDLKGAVRVCGGARNAPGPGNGRHVSGLQAKIASGTRFPCEINFQAAGRMLTV